MHRFTLGDLLEVLLDAGFDLSGDSPDMNRGIFLEGPDRESVGVSIDKAYYDGNTGDIMLQVS